MRIIPQAAVALVCMTALPVDAAAQPALDFARSDFASVARPRAMAVADFDRDGYIDVAQAGSGDATVGIWLNRTAQGGGFVRYRTFAVGGGPFDMAAGDLNRDGWPDLAIANADLEGVTLLISSGAGNWTQRAYAMPGGNPRGLALADRNRDGILDVIVTEYATGAWRILYGDGSGAIAREDRFGGISHPQGVVAADFNRDGWIDVAMASAGINMVAIFASTPTGGIVQRNVTVGGAVNVLAAGDYDRDGWVDLAAASSANDAIYTLRGSAAGFTWSGTRPTLGSPRGMVLADVDHDGWLDLVTANRASDAVAIHLGLAAQPGAFADAHIESAGDGSRAVAAADFDRDGRTDLLTGNEFGNSATWLRNTTPLVAPGLVFSFAPLPPLELPAISSLTVTDLDGNGQPDIVADGGGVILDSATAGQLPGPVFDPVVADFNRDGFADVAALDKYDGRSLRVFRGDGRGRFPGAATVGTWTADDEARDLAVADVNRDGRADLIVTLANWRLGTATLRVYRGAGDGTFAAPLIAPLTAGTNALAVGDLDRDGREDLVFSMVRDGVNDRTLRVLYGDGAGAFPRTTDYTVPANFADVRLADVNHDGRLDVVGVTFELLVVMLGTTEGLGAPVATVNGAYRLAIADINQDGNDDLVLNTPVSVALGHGDGTFDPPLAFNAWSSALAVADMNGDGLFDIVADGSHGVLVNQRNETNRPPVADAGHDLTVTYRDTFNDDEESAILIEGWNSTDPDLHALTFEWRDQSGAILGTDPVLWLPQFRPGTYQITLRVSDGRGASDEDTMMLTITPVREIVLHTVAASGGDGDWLLVEDTSAASGHRLFNADRGAPKVGTPLAQPDHYFDIWFLADPTQQYKLWIRGRAQNDSWGNDSAWVQFDHSLDAAGAPAYRIGTTSALPFNLEECSGCGVSGWGWEDDAWGAVNQNGVVVRFAEGGWQRIRIQTREDGLSIDQIVLSAERYRTTRPGTAKNDATILGETR